jgi:hypothetical protein
MDSDRSAGHGSIVTVTGFETSASPVPFTPIATIP